MSDFRSSLADIAAQEALRPARTYTPEAIAALVKAAEEYMVVSADWSRRNLSVALRPFTTEPPTWGDFAKEFWASGKEFSTSQAIVAYRACYGVEP